MIMYFDDIEDNKIWDADRLIKEYAKIGWRITSGNSYEDIPWCDQILLQRIASVICAYFNSFYDIDNTIRIIKIVFDMDYEFREKSPITSDKMEELKSLLSVFPDCQRDMDRLFRVPNEQSSIREAYRKHDVDSFNLGIDMFRDFMKYRMSAEEMLHYGEGYLCCSCSTSIALSAIEDLYYTRIKEANNQIDKMLVILLGQKFEGSFTVEELIDKYGYPRTTNDELINWEVDNF